MPNVGGSTANSMPSPKLYPPDTKQKEPSRILTPLTDSSINAGPSIHQTRRKRKHSEDDDSFHLQESFVIHAHPSSSSDNTLRLIPRLLISRACLPLVCLDICGAVHGSPKPKLFSARIPALEPTQNRGEHINQPSVLIAEIDASASYYAVERVQLGIYALCKLSDWVTLKQLENSSALHLSHVLQPRSSCEGEAPQTGSDWWRVAVSSGKEITHHEQPKRQKIKDNNWIRLSLKRPECKMLSDVVHAPKNPEVITQESASVPLEDAVIETAPQPLFEEPPPGEILDMIRNQYQESLYMSKTSLAYFAKGPLSRARAAFSNSNDSPTSTSCLTSYLRSIILSLAVMDRKYRETLPEIVKVLPGGALSEDESEQIMAGLEKKAGKSRKAKIGKDGLHPGEVVNITRWWFGRDTLFGLDASREVREDEARIAMLEQRARETQLQMIIVLETLALEASNIKPRVDPGLPGGRVTEEETTTQAQKAKPKKPQNLDTLIDLLIDRLCIWHSTSAEDSKMTGDMQRTIPPRGEKAAETRPNNDPLRDFCVDVILPFYGARLPDRCAMISQKLGGPTLASPPRPPLKKAASTTIMLPKSGTIIQRPSTRKARRTLERVLTDERLSLQKPPPSLLRSTTDSVLPSLKREVSDSSLMAIPASRNVMPNLKRYSQREVDLKTVSQVTEAKLRKKASIEQELQGAIAALKKPNPRMAVRELVESAEMRAAATVSKSRKSRNPVRNPFAQDVQVTATPKGNRQRDVFTGYNCFSQPSTASLVKSENVGPFGSMRVPSSLFRTQSMLHTTPRKSKGLEQQTIPTIAETPSRGPSRQASGVSSAHNDAQYGDGLSQLSSSLATIENIPQLPGVGSRSKSSYESRSWPSVMYESPLKSSKKTMVDVGHARGAQETPVKSSSILDTSLEAPDQKRVECSQMLHDVNETIYERLGWDNDVDELM